MNTKISLLCVLALTTTFTLAPRPTFAGEKPEDVTDAEWAMLPPYCPHTMGYKGHVQPHISKWRGIMGEGFFHMHHYCWALIDFHRAQRSTISGVERQNLRQRALGGFRYVIKNAPEDFILLPEIFTWVGRSEVSLGNAKGASNAFNQAIKLKPDYWPPYYHFADLLYRKGQKKDAFEVAKAGLSYSPNAKPLLLLFGELGGKPKDIPKPIVKPEEPSEPSNTPVADGTPGRADTEVLDEPTPSRPTENPQ